MSVARIVTNIQCADSDYLMQCDVESEEARFVDLHFTQHRDHSLKICDGQGAEEAGKRRRLRGGRILAGSRHCLVLEAHIFTNQSLQQQTAELSEE